MVFPEKLGPKFFLNVMGLTIELASRSWEADDSS
jgi:hypothetical protein